MKKNFFKTIKFLWLTAQWFPSWVRNKPLVWEDTVTGEETSEQWSRKNTLVFRPRCWAFLNTKPCGCVSRFGRIVYYNMDCKDHGGWVFGEENEFEEG